MGWHGQRDPEPAWRTVASSVSRRSNGVLRLDIDCLMGHRRRKELCGRPPWRLPARIEAVLCCWSCVYFERSNLYHGLAPLPMLRLVWLQHRPRAGTPYPSTFADADACLALPYGHGVQHAEYGVWQLDSSHRTKQDKTRQDESLPGYCLRAKSVWTTRDRLAGLITAHRQGCQRSQSSQE